MGTSQVKIIFRLLEEIRDLVGGGRENLQVSGNYRVLTDLVLT